MCTHVYMYVHVAYMHIYMNAHAQATKVKFDQTHGYPGPTHP